MNNDPTERRLKDLEDNIRRDQDLLKSYEDKERYESDPRSLAECRRDIERLRESLAQNQQEYVELKKEASPAEKDTKLDEIQKLLPSVPTTGEENFDIFLSHSHLDAAWVEELARQLVDRCGLRVWLDKWITVLGEPWRQAIAIRHDNAKSCAVCIGEQTPEGWFQEEIGRALNHQEKDTSFRVIPVLLPNVRMTNVDNFLELRTWIDFRNGLYNSQEFHRLVSGIRGVAPGRGPQENVALESSYTPVRVGLIKLRQYNSEGLIDEGILREYQRKLLDKDLLKRGDYSNG